MGTASSRLSRAGLQGWRVPARVTRSGWIFFGVSLLVGLAAWQTGNSLTTLVMAGLCAVLVISVVLAEWNLRGLRVRRALPAEVHAGLAAPGAFLIHNPRRWGAAWSVQIEERVGAGAHARLMVVPRGHTARAPTRWIFPERGRATLARVRIASTYPFGLWLRWRDVALPASLLVYPAPSRGAVARPVAGVGAVRHDSRKSGRGGDLRGLRPYQPGDPLRDLHWPTSARVGSPMVVVRSAAVSDEVLVEVGEARGSRWEAALERACGEVLLHCRQGRAVGLRLGDRLLSPRTGEGWRRHLLELLALAPRRGEPSSRRGPR